MSQEDGKSDFFSLDPPLTLSPPKSTPAKKAEPETVVTPQLAAQPAPAPAPVQAAPPPQPAAPTPTPAPAPVAKAPAAPPQPPADDDTQVTHVDDDDDVIIVDDDGDDHPAPQPAAPAPAPAAAPDPAPAQPPAPPTIDELADMTAHADLADAMAQVSSSPVSAPTATTVLRQARPQRPPSQLKKTMVPVLFTIGSILMFMGGWALMAHMKIVNKLAESASEQAIAQQATRIKIGLVGLPVGLLLLLAAVFWGIQVATHTQGTKASPGKK